MRNLLVSLSILGSSLSTFGQDFPLGQKIEAPISFCTTPEEAQAVVQTHKERGVGAAARMVHESQTCDTAYVGFMIRRVVSSTQIGSHTVFIIQIDIEMVDESWKPFYAMLITGGGGTEV